MLDSPSQDSWPSTSTSPSGISSVIYPALKERMLGSVQAACLSAIFTIFWCGISSRSSGHSFWTYPNLLAGLFYGQNSLRPDFGFHTLTGLSIHLLLTTIFALLFASLAPPVLKPLSSMLLGILAATSWFYLLDGFFWRRAFQPVTLYSRRPSIFFSFVLMGICIGLYSVFVRSSKETQISAKQALP